MGIASQPFRKTIANILCLSAAPPHLERVRRNAITTCAPSEQNAKHAHVTEASLTDTTLWSLLPAPTAIHMAHSSQVEFQYL